MMELIAEKRNILGKKVVSARKAGKLPVVIYGSKEKSAPFFISIVDFKKVFAKAGESTVISFRDGNEEKDVLIHDVAYDSVSGEPIHVDFYAIAKGQKVEVQVPIEFTGISSAVKSLGGILVKVMHEIEVKAEPKNLPHKIEISIESLATFEDQILLKDVVLPVGVEVIGNLTDVVALVSAPKEEKEEEVEAPVDLTKIEVEKKGKKPEEEGEEATEKGK